MKKFLLIFMLIAAGTLIWYISSRLSADAIGMAIGILLGVLAGLPAAILVMASGRRQADREESRASRQNPYGLPGQAAPGAPIIVLAGHGYPNGSPMPGQQQSNGFGAPQQLALPGPQGNTQERHFKVVGEREEWIDEW